MSRFTVAASLGLTVGLLAALPAQAQLASANFNVNVTLTSVCRVATNTAGLAIPYTAFQNTDASGTAATVAYECTRGLAPNIAFDANGSDKQSAAAAATGEGSGVVAGLRYTMSTTASAIQAGTDATAGVGGNGGSAQTRTYAVGVTIPSGQAGAGAGATISGTHARTLLLSY